MESFADEAVNELSCMCSAQSAKTLTMLCLLAWCIAEDPGPILWVTASLQAGAGGVHDVGGMDRADLIGAVGDHTVMGEGREAVGD